jgi:hypothetical protein
LRGERTREPRESPSKSEFEALEVAVRAKQATVFLRVQILPTQYEKMFQALHRLNSVPTGFLTIIGATVLTAACSRAIFLLRVFDEVASLFDLVTVRTA